jgi:spore maturation protein A
MVKSASSKDRLMGTVRSMVFSSDGTRATIQFILEPIRFVKLKAVTQAALDYASTAVTIALGLIGIMALWLGVMKVAEEAGLLKVVTRILTPVTKRLFPDVPPDHPAVSAMIMNTAANMLGLSNAATPLGLKAMEELNKLNPKVGTATNAMITFLTINTGGLILIPATAIAVRAAAGSANPGIIIGTSIFGASCATVAGVAAAKLLQRLPRYRRDLEPDRTAREEENHG